MYRYLLKANRKTAAYLIFAPLSAISSVAVAWAMSAAIDYASGGTLSELWRYLIAFGVYIVLDLVLCQLFRHSHYALVKQAMVRLRMDAYHHIAHLPWAQYQSHNSAEYLANLTSDMELLRDSYFSVLLAMYTELLRFVIAAAALFWISPVLGVFVFAMALVQMCVPILYAKRLERAGAAYSDGQKRYMVRLKENLAAFLTARTFHLERQLEQRHAEALEQAEEKKRAMKTLSMWTNTLSFSLSNVTYLGTFLLGAVLSIQGKLSAAQIVGASQLIVYIAIPLSTISADLSELRSAKAASGHVTTLLRTPVEEAGTAQLPALCEGFCVQNLYFSYGEREILRDISCTFELGKKYLLVGGSGSGKSTLLNLLAGLRTDYTGSITLGGIPVRELRRESLTRWVT